MLRRPPRFTCFPSTTLFRSVGESATEDHAHRVVEIALAHLALDEQVGDPAAGRGRLRVGHSMAVDSCRGRGSAGKRSEEHTSELQSLTHLVCRLLHEKKKML